MSSTAPPPCTLASYWMAAVKRTSRKVSKKGSKVCSKIKTNILPTPLPTLPTEVLHHIYEFNPDHRQLMKDSLHTISHLHSYCFFREGIRKMKTDYKTSISSISNISNSSNISKSSKSYLEQYPFGVEITLLGRRVYHLHVDTNFPFSSPKISFIKDLYSNQTPPETMTMRELWETPNKNLALTVICYDYINYVNV
jgi:hypothetical protein